MKILQFLILLPLFLCAKEADKDSITELKIIQLQREVHNLNDTLKSHKDQYKSLEEHEIIEKVNTYYDSAWNKLMIMIGIFSTIIGVITPFVISWYQQRTFNNLIDITKADFERQITSLTESNSENIRILSEKVDRQVVNLSNENSMQLQELNNSFAEKTESINREFEIKWEELRTDYVKKIKRIDSNLWNHMSRLAAKDENYTTACGYLILSLNYSRSIGSEDSIQTAKLKLIKNFFDQFTTSEDLAEVEKIVNRIAKNFNLETYIKKLKDIEIVTAKESCDAIIKKYNELKA